jgi:hypothetical protein
MKPVSAGLAGAGLIGNLITQKQRSDELSYIQNQQKALQDPTKLAAQVAAATQPLDRALTESVGNVVSGNLAEQGLSQAPGIQAQALAQGLAPFQQQNQQTALQLVLERLGLPVQLAYTYLQGLPQQVGLAPLLALFGKGNPAQQNAFSYWPATHATPFTPTPTGVGAGPLEQPDLTGSFYGPNPSGLPPLPLDPNLMDFWQTTQPPPMNIGDFNITDTLAQAA